MSKISLLILAAGMGSRYKGQKQIDTITDYNESLLEFALYDALQVGIRKFVFIINNQFPEDFQQKLNQIAKNNSFEIHFVIQTIDKYIPLSFLPKLNGRIKPLGTAHAILCAKEIIQEVFITINADDFYGRQSYAEAINMINQQQIDENNYGMIAFKLINTLSENGAVSRGVCSIRDQKLISIEEFTNIYKKALVIQGKDENLNTQTLHEADLVSMNFWILHPSFFKFAQYNLLKFLNAHEDLSTIEFYLPSVINYAIHHHVNLRVSQSSEKWFGLTYREDKTIVTNEISKRKGLKEYPNKLWH